MIILRIEQLKNKKNKITLDNDECFYLYDSELNKLGLCEQDEIDEALFNKIFEEYLYARAKKKALAILNKTICSKHQMKMKLRKHDFSEDVIEKVINLLIEYNLLNDEEYAKTYVASYKNKKSIREIEFELDKRGIDRETIKKLIEGLEGTEIEIININKIMNKYRDAEGYISLEKKQKIMASLYRKGYNRHNIMKVLDSENFR